MSVEIPDKSYFKIGEVGRILGVEPYNIRYWESQFRLKPAKTKSRQRLYRRKDIELLLRIKSLLYDEGYTISGAKKQLKFDTKGDVSGEHPAVLDDEERSAYTARLAKSQSELSELRAENRTLHTDLQRQRDEYRRGLRLIADERERLLQTSTPSGTNGILAAKLELAEEARAEAEAALVRRATEIEDLERRLERALLTVAGNADLNEQLAQAQQAATAATEDLARAHSDLAQFRITLAETNAAHAGRLADLVDKNQGLQQQLDIQRQSLDDAGTAITTQLDEERQYAREAQERIAARFDADVHEVAGQRDKLASALGDLEAENRRLQQAFDESDSGNAALRQQLQKTAEKLDEADRTLRRLRNVEDDRNRLAGDCEALSQQLGRLQTAHEVRGSEADSAHKELVMAQATILRLQPLKTQLDQANQKLEAGRDVVVALGVANERIGTLEDTLETSRAANAVAERTRVELIDARGRISDLELRAAGNNAAEAQLLLALRTKLEPLLKPTSKD